MGRARVSSATGTEAKDGTLFYFRSVDKLTPCPQGSRRYQTPFHPWHPQRAIHEISTRNSTSSVKFLPSGADRKSRRDEGSNRYSQGRVHRNHRIRARRRLAYREFHLASIHRAWRVLRESNMVEVRRGRRGNKGKD